MTASPEACFVIIYATINNTMAKALGCDADAIAFDSSPEK